MKRQSTLVLIAVLLAGMLFNFTPQAQPAQAVSPNVVISAVYGGGGNSGAPYRNDYIELFNRGSATVDLAGWSVQYASSSGTTWQRTNLSGSIAPGQYFLVHEALGANTALPYITPDVTGSIPMSATSGKVALVSSTTTLSGSCPTGVVDFVGFGGANCSETAPTPALTNSTAAARLINGCFDTDNNSIDFVVGDPAPRNSSIIQPCGPEIAPSVTSTYPATGDSTIHQTANVTVSFSEPVSLSPGWYDLTCSLAGIKTAVVSGGPINFTINPDADFLPGDTCTLNIYAAQVADLDMEDPPNNLDADLAVTFNTVDACTQPFSPIYDIQGSGLSAAITGFTTTKGVVVGDFEGSSAASGFYIQDMTGDGNTATSDGIFIYTGSNNLVNVGEVVWVTGFARERFNQTTINSSDNDSSAITADKMVKCGTGSVTQVEVTMPFEDSTYLERFEGMLVNFPQTLTIAEYFNYDRYGEMVLALPLDGETRPFQGTALEEPGPDAIERAYQNSLRRITLDDVNSFQNPFVLRHPNGDPFSLTNRFRGGDLVSNTTGILGYDFSLYRILPTGPSEYIEANPRPEAPEPVGGNLQVAAMNTLNYFLTLDYPTGNALDNKCGPLKNQECRGADSDQPLEFTRQRAKLLAALTGLDADVVGLNEIENTTGVEPLADIVAGLNDALGAGTYAYIDTGTIGTDAIKVGLIYRPAVVTPVGSYQILDSTDDPRFIDTKSRPALAQTFEEISTGQRFTVVVNHLKSKGSACDDIGDPDLGDGQGNCSGTRTLAAQALVDWLATDPTGSSDPDFLIMGDLNSYAMEDPIDAILEGPDDVLGTADDYTNLILKYQGPYAYSYVFDGQLGYLDHALANTSLLSQVSGTADWHINADEPDVLDYDTSFKPNSQDALYEPNAYRSSDHDAVVVGLDLNTAPVVGPISVAPNPVKVQVETTASAEFSDLGDSDPHTGVWDWGDGSTSPAVIVEAGGNGTATGSHAYASAGLYTVKLTVTDFDGLSTEVSYQYVVVFDPAAGFFTGGGWVDSAAGAYLPDPTLVGKAEFVFDIKYLKNALIPTGSTTMLVEAGGLYFQSTGYDWLVVIGNHAQFQGSGMLNGMDGYKFQVFATDGSPDTFRMIIWTEDEMGMHLVYDNGAELALGGGSIQLKFK